MNLFQINDIWMNSSLILAIGSLFVNTNASSLLDLIYINPLLSILPQM